MRPAPLLSVLQALEEKSTLGNTLAYQRSIIFLRCWPGVKLLPLLTTKDQDSQWIMWKWQSILTTQCPSSQLTLIQWASSLSTRKPHFVEWQLTHPTFSQFAFSHQLLIRLSSLPLLSKSQTLSSQISSACSIITRAAPSTMDLSASRVSTSRLAHLWWPPRFSAAVVSPTSHSWRSQRSPSSSATMGRDTRRTSLRLSSGRMEPSLLELTWSTLRLSSPHSRSTSSAA